MQLSVFITGGASGIGAATARRIVKDGGHVAIVDLNVGRGAGARSRNRQSRSCALGRHHEYRGGADRATTKRRRYFRPSQASSIVRPRSRSQRPSKTWHWRNSNRVLNSHVTGTLIRARWCRQRHGVRAAAAPSSISHPCSAIAAARRSPTARANPAS